MENPSIVSPDALRRFAREILIALELPPPSADLVAESLVSADLRGVDSHGVHLLPHYVKQLENANLDPKAEGHVISESGACLLYDGENGIGQVIAMTCCGHAARLAKEHGLGLAISRRSNHFGAAAFWAQKMSAHGLIGIVFSNASPAVPPWQGREGRFGTNPFCVSVPSSGEGGWLLDMATTRVALNKIVKAADQQDEIPAGWALNSQGVPTTNIDEALGGLLMPLGEYKGSGLAMMIEILCAGLSGGAMSTEVGGLHILERRMNISQFFLAIDVGCFLPLPDFQQRMEHLVKTVKSARPAEGYGEVLVAGEPEWNSEARFLREGIPVAAGVWKRLVEIADHYEVPVP
jgi:LDH2 family malate/lactate/ureidoglycolate dehydrogenase